MSSFDAGSIIGTLELDRDPFTAGLDLAKVDAESFEANVRPTVKLDVEDDEALAKFVEIDAAIDALNKKSITIDTKTTTTGLDDVTNAADKASGKSGGGGIGGLMMAALALSPALLPVLPVAAAGIITLGGAFLSAASGVGIFALAAEGSLKNVEAQATSVLSTWQKAMGPLVAAPLQGAVNLLQPLLASLTPILVNVSNDFFNIEIAISKVFDNPAFKEFISWLASQAQQAIMAFANAFLGMLSGAAFMLEQATPLLEGFYRLLNEIGNSSWSGGATKGVQEFFAYVAQDGPPLLALLETLGHDIEELVVALSPATLPMLGFLQSAASFLEAVIPAITPVIQAFGMLLQVLTPIAGPLVLIVAGLVAVKKAMEIQTAIEAFATSLGLIGPAGTVAAAGEAEAASGMLLFDAALALDPITDILIAIVALAAAADLLIVHWSGVSTFFSELWGNIENSTVTGVNDTMNFFQQLPTMLENLEGDAGQWLYEVGADIIQGLMNGINDLWQGVVGDIHAIGQDITDIFQDVLGIASPSKVFAGIGNNIMLGLASGLNETYSSTVAPLMSGLSKSTSMAFNPELSANASISSPALQAVIAQTQSQSTLTDQLVGLRNDIRALPAATGAATGAVVNGSLGKATSAAATAAVQTARKK